MKRLIFLLMLGGLILLNNTAKAQVTYSYDEAGNRVLRHSIIKLTSSRAKKVAADSMVQKEAIGEQEIIIYPNPTKGILKIEIKGRMSEDPVTYLVSDLNGHRLLQNISKEQLNNCNLNDFSPGVYILTLLIDGKRKEWKIVKE